MTTPVQEFVSVLIDSHILTLPNHNPDIYDNWKITFQQTLPFYCWILQKTLPSQFNMLSLEYIAGHIASCLCISPPSMSFLLNYFWWYGSCVIGSPDTNGMHWTCQKENAWLDKNSILFRWMCSPIQKPKKLSKFMPSYNRLQCRSRMGIFAISHGKPPCDRIGGIMKRTATKVSLQRPYKGQI